MNSCRNDSLAWKALRGHSPATRHSNVGGLSRHMMALCSASSGSERSVSSSLYCFARVWGASKIHSAQSLQVYWHWNLSRLRMTLSVREIPCLGQIWQMRRNSSNSSSTAALCCTILHTQNPAAPLSVPVTIQRRATAEGILLMVCPSLSPCVTSSSKPAAMTSWLPNQSSYRR